jgi:hypothetical protein
MMGHTLRLLLAAAEGFRSRLSGQSHVPRPEQYGPGIVACVIAKASRSGWPKCIQLHMALPSSNQGWIYAHVTMRWWRACFEADPYHPKRL